MRSSYLKSNPCIFFRVRTTRAVPMHQAAAHSSQYIKFPVLFCVFSCFSTYFFWTEPGSWQLKMAVWETAAPVALRRGHISWPLRAPGQPSPFVTEKRTRTQDFAICRMGGRPMSVLWRRIIPGGTSSLASTLSEIPMRKRLGCVFWTFIIKLTIIDIRSMGVCMFPAKAFRGDHPIQDPE